MEPNTLIYVLNEFIVIYYKIILIVDNFFTIINFFSIIKFQTIFMYKLLGYIWLLGTFGYIWLLGTFVNSSCDIKINIKIDKIAV